MCVCRVAVQALKTKPIALWVYIAIGCIIQIKLLVYSHWVYTAICIVGVYCDDVAEACCIVGT